jgi:DNA-binding transcriptional LysR family regulator
MSYLYFNNNNEYGLFVVNINRLSLRMIMALDALLSERSVSRAAKKLELTQPTLSISLNQLREIFDDDLFVKGGRAGLNLTPLAQRLEPFVKQVLNDVDKLAASVEDFNPATAERTFNIGAAEFPEFVILPKLLVYLSKYAPKIKVNVENVVGLHEYKGREKLDLYLGGIFSKLYLHKRDSKQLLLTDKFVLVARKKHQIMQAELNLRNYMGLQYIVAWRQESRFAMSYFKALFKKFAPISAIIAPHVVPMLDIIENSDFVTITTEQFARYWAKHFDLSYKDLPFKSPAHQIFQIWPQELDSDQGHCWLRDVIVNHCLPK